MTSQECVEAPLAISAPDQKEIQALYEKFQKSRAKLVGPDGKTQNLPVSLYKFLVELIVKLQEGHCVTIVQNDATLTTVEAAKMLGVSRQYLVTVLTRNEVPFHMVGTHRRIYVRDLLAYKAKRDQGRRKLLDDLVKSEIAEGVYDRVPLNAPESGE